MFNVYICEAGDKLPICNQYMIILYANSFGIHTSEQSFYIQRKQVVVIWLSFFNLNTIWNEAFLIRCLLKFVDIGQRILLIIIRRRFYIQFTISRNAQYNFDGTLLLFFILLALNKCFPIVLSIHCFLL